MKAVWISTIGTGLTLLLFTMLSALLQPAPVQAAAHSSLAAANTLTLSIDNGTTFTYGGTPAPTFTAVVVFGVKPTANYFWTISGKLDDGEVFGSSGFPPTSSQDGMTLTFTRVTSNTPFTVGQHTAIAKFFDPGTNTTVDSNPVSFTGSRSGGLAVQE